MPPLFSHVKWFDWIEGLGVIFALILFDHWLFRVYLHTSHMEWYLANGTAIGFATALIATTWGDINKNQDLVSSHPLRYIKACCWVVGLLAYSIGTHLRAGDNCSRRPSLYDTLLTFFFVIILLGLILLWGVVIAPLQYLINLICGAPARLYLRSGRRPIARFDDKQLTVKEIGIDDPIPSGWWDAGVFSRPVAITSLLSSIYFAIVQYVTPYFVDSLG